MSFQPDSDFTSARPPAALVSILGWLLARFVRHALFLPLILWLTEGTAWNSAGGVFPATNAVPRFNVKSYVVEDNALLPANVWIPILSKYTGANLSIEKIVRGASDLQAEYRNHGYPATSIAIAREQITNGVVTLNIFQTAIPQIIVSGIAYTTNGAIASNLPAIAPVLIPETIATASVTNAPPPVPRPPLKPASPAQIAAARADVLREMAELEKGEIGTRIHVVSTNAGPRFKVERYRVMGNTILSPQKIAMVLTNIDGDYGTNVSIDGIRTVVEQLQAAYHDRGYVTVAVGLPQQKLANATVKVQVFEGHLEAINVEGNRYFSSNNVMRALPGLHTNMVLNAPIFNAELNRANANQDRQIYPVISPGSDPGASALTLHVKDQMPVHAKLELDNQNSPGTPDLRLNGSAVEDNLWQHENSLGVQYGFSPETYKPGNEWNFYDRPTVADYSAFYRLPLGNPEPIENEVANNPGKFGYDEATRKFNVPPPSGNPDLTLFASRAAIDPGLATTSSSLITSAGEDPSISQQTVEDSPTLNEDLGARLNLPLPAFGNLQSSFSGGLDFKTYDITSYKTNVFDITQTNFDTQGNPILPPSISTVPSAVPLTTSRVEYLPLSLRYDGNLHDSLGTWTFGLGVSANLWLSALYSTSSSSIVISTNAGAISTNNVTTTTSSHGASGLQNTTGSKRSTGYWFVITPSFSRGITINNWTTLFRADGQWASEPLISSEQFGIGGVNSVRGYHEGELFGDDGWHVTLEEDTPPRIVGMVSAGQPLTIRGSIYMDGATAYVINPPAGEPMSSKLWGTGVGLSMAVGAHWQAQFLFSVPLISTSLVPRYNPYFNFSLTGQF